MIHSHTGFMSISDFAKCLICSRQAIHKAIKENRLDAYFIGKQYVIKIEDGEKFRSKRRGRR